MKKKNELKFTHSLKKKNPRIRVHMDHGHVKDIVIFFILVESFLGWSEVIKLTERKATTAQQVLSTIFWRNRKHKMIVIDDIPECCDKILCLWFKRIGWIPYKYPPKIWWDCAKYGAKCDNGVTWISSFTESVEAYLLRHLLTEWFLVQEEKFVCLFSLFNGMPTFGGYLMPNQYW